MAGEKRKRAYAKGFEPQDVMATRGSRKWAKAPLVDNPAYGKARPTKDASGAVFDLYFADEPVEEPLLLFHHIQKTAGTSLRHVIHSNYPRSELKMESVPEDPQGLADWHREYWSSLADSRDRVQLIASHYAAYFLPVIDDRPVRAFTLLRDPVDRALSRFHFFSKPPDWTFESMYGEFESAQTWWRRLLPWSEEKRNDALKGRNFFFFNGMGKSLLAPFYDVREIPVLEGASSAVWRDRLFDLVDTHFLVGLQERFMESVELFADEFGWPNVWPATLKVNHRRMPLEAEEPETVELIRRYNWLDDALYRRYVARLEDLQVSTAG